VVSPTWSINYFPYNFDSKAGADGHAGAVFSQLYFRQAMQELINQAGMITSILKGYAIPTYGPVPVLPTNKFAAGAELKTGGPYPYSVTTAVNTLKANGWKVVPSGTSTCIKPGTAKGDCGLGIPMGTPLNFSEVYYDGSTATTEITQFEVGQWGQAGIQVKTTGKGFTQVLAEALPCLPANDPPAGCTKWDLANWGGGWLFSPDYLPTGEEIFATGAGSNAGDYNSNENNTLIVDTNTSSSQSYFTEWENYLATQLPVVWQPDGVGTTEVAKNLLGVTPLNALANLDPEYWHYS
jgi:peptide/nickel transport system substrate-binding protein